MNEARQPPQHRSTGVSPVDKRHGRDARAAAFLLCVLFLVSFAPAQTTQPASIYDNQPLKRARSEVVTPAPTSTGPFDWSRLVLAMGVVIGLIVILRYVVSKMYPGVGASKGTKVVRVLSRSPIAPKQQVMLLQVGKRVIVIGDSAGQLSSLSEISDPDEVASLVGQLENVEVPVTGNRFSNLFNKAQDDFTDKPLAPQREPEPSQEIEEAQTEISGLIERMRLLTRTVRRD